MTKQNSDKTIKNSKKKTDVKECYEGVATELNYKRSHSFGDEDEEWQLATSFLVSCFWWYCCYTCCGRSTSRMNTPRFGVIRFPIKDKTELFEVGVILYTSCFSISWLCSRDVPVIFHLSTLSDSAGHCPLTYIWPAFVALLFEQITEVVESELCVMSHILFKPVISR